MIICIFDYVQWRWALGDFNVQGYPPPVWNHTVGSPPLASHAWSAAASAAGTPAATPAGGGFPAGRSAFSARSAAAAAPCWGGKYLITSMYHTTLHKTLHLNKDREVLRQRRLPGPSPPPQQRRTQNAERLGSELQRDNTTSRDL
jgi:hypothetical protein